MVGVFGTGNRRPTRCVAKLVAAVVSIQDV